MAILVDNTSTQEVILRLQNGSLDALGELYDRYNQMVYRTALAIIGEPETASDLLQEVFLRLNRFADRIDPQRPLEPWLYRVTTNLAYTWAKRRRWLQPLEEITEWFSGDQSEQPAQAVESNEEWRQIEKAIRTLPLAQRLVIVHYYINDCSLEEISQILDVPTGTVKSRLHYGRQALKKHLDGQRGLVAEVNYEFT
jgi:RNA polymerase sigma-70 factor (ECF subfamily)